MSAWRGHFGRFPPAGAVAVVSLWLHACNMGATDLAKHLTVRFPAAFSMLGIAADAEIDAAAVDGVDIDADLRAAGIY